MRLIVFVVCFLFVSSTALAQGGLDQRVSDLSKQIADKMSAKQKSFVISHADH